MKPFTFWPGAVLAITGALATLSSATAAITSYADGDLILGFRDATKATNDYMVNIGPASVYRDAAAGFDLNVGAIGADLISIYGVGWATDPDIHWSVTGTSGLSAVGSDPARTIYATRDELVLGTQATAWTIASSTNRANTMNRMLSLGATYTGQTSTANNALGLSLSPNAINSYSSFQPGGTIPNSQGGLHYGNLSGVEGSFANGPAGTALDLFRNPNTGTAADYEGTFTISGSGQVSFGLSPVPEPGSLALVGIAVGFIATRRRRNPVTI